MTSIEEAKTIINTHTNPLEKIRLDSSNASGYVLAQDILSTLNLPSFNQSAMDGYALNFSESEETEFNLVGEIKTGDSHTHSLQSGECFRIFTGAMIPEKTPPLVNL
jgi:molybdopterin molybdotransferase